MYAVITMQMEDVRSGRGRGGAFRGAGNEVEDAQTAVALNQRFVAADLVVDLRTDSYLADHAVSVARFGDGEPLALVRDVLEQAQRVGESFAARLVRAVDA